MKILKLLFLILFLVFPFGQLARLPLGIPSVNLYLHDLVIGLILLIWFGQHFLKKKKFKLPPLSKPIFGFIAAAFLSLLLAASQRQPGEIFIGSLYLLRWLAYAGIYFVVYENSWLHGWILKWLIAAGVTSAFLGLLQYAFLPDTRFLYYSGWDDHYYRVIGTFLDPGFTGIIYVLALILIVVKFWDKKTILYSLSSILYLSLALTYSRSAYLAYLAGMGIIAFKKKAPKFFAVILSLFLITVFLLPRPSSEGVQLERRTSVLARVGNWQQSWQIIKDHPIFGVGFNFYRYSQRDYGFLGEDWQTSHAGAGADSSLLSVLATTGIVGFIFYLWLLWEMTKICPIATLALIVHSFFNNSLFYPWIMVWMWTLLSIQ